MNKLLTEIRAFLANEALTIVTSFCLLWFLQDQVLDAYPVPTPSMEPTIEGDPRLGDRVLVDKTFDNRSQPERFDMIVFWQPKDRRTVVKRVAGMPDELIQIRSGDLYVGPTVETMKLVQKSPTRDSDMLATYWDSKLGEGFADDDWRRSPTATIDTAGRLILGGSRDRAAMRWQEEITNAYVDGFGKLIWRNSRARDFGVELWVKGQPKATQWIELRFPQNSFALAYDCQGTASLWRNHSIMKLGRKNTVPVPPITDDKAHRILFMHLDGNLCVSVDGTDYIRQAIPATDLGFSLQLRGARNGLSIAATDGRTTIERARIIHDFHYEGQGGNAVLEPYRVPRDSYFLLGDNSSNSTDSRFFGAVPRNMILGRPLMIVTPFRRFHVFPR